MIDWLESNFGWLSSNAPLRNRYSEPLKVSGEIIMAGISFQHAAANGSGYSNYTKTKGSLMFGCRGKRRVNRSES